MKRNKFIIVALTVLLLVVALVACDTKGKTQQPKDTYILSKSQSLLYTLTVGDDVDFTQYFSIVKVSGVNGNNDIGEIVPVMTDMLDLTDVDLTKAGTFDVTLSYGGKTLTATFTVVASGASSIDFDALCANYDSYDKWNFGVNFAVEIGGNEGWEYQYGYLKDDVSMTYLYYGQEFTDYIAYDTQNDTCYYYADNGDGTYSLYGEEDDDFALLYMNVDPLELTNLSSLEFTEKNGRLVADNPQAAGEEILGGYTDTVWTSLEIFVQDNRIVQIKATANNFDENNASVEYAYYLDFDNYGGVSIDLNALTVLQPGIDMHAIFDQYDSYDKWNFVVDFDVKIGAETMWNYVYDLLGDDIRTSYEYEGVTYTDYLVYDAETETFKYYADDGTGNYTVVNQDDDLFMELYYGIDTMEFTTLNNIAFEEKDGHYAAKYPTNAGSNILGQYEDGTWSSLDLYVQDGKISKIVAVLDLTDGSGQATFTLTFSGYGSLDYDVDNITGGGSTPSTGDYHTEFISAGLGVNDGDLEYSSNVGANSLDANRGLQFLMQNGTVILTSKSTIDNVTSVVVAVATNQEAGMTVSVSVGSTALLCDGQVNVNVSKQSTFTEITTLTFTSSSAVSGNITVTLKETATKKSMYIKTIDVHCGEGGGGTDPVDPNKNVMEKQVYDESTFDKSNLQEKMVEKEDTVGLPSKGTYNCLVVPVQFAGTTISAQDLANLEKALNGSAADTGWESVKTYYQKASYGELNLTFDIQSVYQSARTANDYAVMVDSEGYSNGSDAVLIDVLTYLEPRMDLSKYDSNSDGCIDAVYLIYSAPVDYTNADFFWAYVTWYQGENKYDNLDAYTYFFAGFDFMGEDVQGSGNDNGNGVISGLKVNASTYIHETGHLLGLDDYYDYYETQGSNEGLGGADMMDYTVGDHNAYSKIMLGWVQPKIVTATTTITINALATDGSCILIPLDFNNSYFCEYLLVDLYSAKGLNALHASQTNSILYDGASYGVRIYHVAAWVTNPYKSDEYGSFTDNNNSISKNALIKLVEADGEKKFAGTDGYASETDLWQAGDRLGSVFANYTRYDGKKLNFDITIVSVNADSATITITFAA